MKQFCKWWLCVSVIFGIAGGVTSAQEDWMPDANLRRLVSDHLGVETLTIADMQNLYDLISVERSEIASLEGIQHAINLEFLHIGRALISDLSFLSDLKKLEVLKLHDNEIVDISALSGLTNLETLVLPNNQIIDITALANLTNLETLVLTNNQIRVFTPLIGLTQLEYLRTDHNPAVFYNIEEFCEFPSPDYVRSVVDRIENRSYPSTFISHIGMGNRDDLGPLEKLVLWDLSFGDEPFQSDGEHYLEFYNSKDGIRYKGESLNELISSHRNALNANPNMLLLVEITYFDGRNFNIPLDSPYWLRHPDGSIAHRKWGTDIYGNELLEPLLDFSHPEVQELIIGQAVAVALCGLYDGIWLDRWSVHSDFGGELSGLMSHEVELEARDRILRGIRKATPNDFLIIVNSTWQKIPRWASLVNGVFIETWEQEENYIHQDFQNYEDVIIWYEANLREPNFTLLRGEIQTHNAPEASVNQQVMRAFTTLSLTHSDGYVTMSSEPPQYTHWYDFWEAELGQPVGEKAQLYENREGLFIREFTNGWAVYNRSGKTQEISLPEQAIGVKNGLRNTIHVIPDLDGEIYLKQETRLSADVNGDGVVNIQDLVLVANAFGEAEPDLNGDDVVNIQDLVIVASAFGQ